MLFVELEASLKTRLDRNLTEHRQHHKPSKRDTAFSEKLLREGEASRSNSDGDFPYSHPHLKINNETLSPPQVVSEICAHFWLKADVERL